jgi:hypothetical protein
LNIGVTCAVFHVVGKTEEARDILNMLASGTAIFGEDSFSSRNDILSIELAAGDLSEAMASLTSRSLNGVKLNAAGLCWPEFIDVLSMLWNASLIDCENFLVMLLTQAMKKLFIILAEAFEMSGDEHGHAIAV